jgi:Domain of unknown function (DUF5710)
MIINLTVPKADEVKVKRLGAKFNLYVKCWFITTSSIERVKKFRQWLPNTMFLPTGAPFRPMDKPLDDCDAAFACISEN